MLKIRRAMTLIAIFLAIGSIVPVVTSTPAAAATPLLGAYVGGGNVQAASFEADTGTELTLVSDYLPAGSWANISDPTWITRTWAGTGHRLALSVPMLPSGATPSVGLAAGASGNYNSYFLTLAQRLVSGGLGNTILRLGWEFTGNWFPWAATNATLAGEYAEYFRQIVTVMQTVPGQQFQFDWNPTPGPQPYDLTLAYPGDQYVDYVSMDVYDQSWSPNHTPQSTWRSIETNGYGLDWLASFAAQHNKEMALPEWGISVYPGGYGNGDNPYFIQQLSSWINSTMSAISATSTSMPPVKSIRLPMGIFQILSWRIRTPSVETPALTPLAAPAQRVSRKCKPDKRGSQPIRQVHKRAVFTAWAWPPRPMEEGIGRWPLTAGSSASAMLGSMDRWVALI